MTAGICYSAHYDAKNDMMREDFSFLYFDLMTKTYSDSC